MFKKLVFLFLLPFRLILLPFFLIACFINLMFWFLFDFLFETNHFSKFSISDNPVVNMLEWLSCNWRGTFMNWPLYNVDYK